MAIKVETFPPPGAFELDWEGLKQMLDRTAPELNAGALVKGMRKLRPQYSPSQVYFAVATERMMGAGSRIVAERRGVQAGAPTFQYFVTWESPVEGGRLGATHAVELPLVFDTVATSPSIIGDDAEDALKVADAMSSAWIQFARTGSPNGPGLPRWPAFYPQRRPTMVFDVVSQAVDDPLGEEWELLAAAGMPGSAGGLPT